MTPREGAGRSSRRRPPGRPHGPTGPLRRRILDAAGARFAEVGYDRATVRAIAARARVDPSLLYHYFEGKEALFLEGFQQSFQPLPQAGPPGRGAPVDIGEQIVRRHLEERDREGANGPLLALMRSNGSLPKATALLREFIEETIPATVGRLLPGDAETRASLVAVQLLGLTYVRDILGVESLRRRSSDELAVLLGPLVTAVLTTPLPVPRTPGAPGLRPRHQPGPDGRPRRGRPK